MSQRCGGLQVARKGVQAKEDTGKQDERKKEERDSRWAKGGTTRADCSEDERESGGMGQGGMGCDGNDESCELKLNSHTKCVCVGRICVRLTAKSNMHSTHELPSPNSPRRQTPHID